MSNLYMNNEATYTHGAPTALLEALLKVLDAGGRNLRVHVIDGNEVNSFRDLPASAIANCNAVAVWFNEKAAEGRINPRVLLLGGEASAAGKRFAVVGVSRRRLSGEAQRLADWVIY